MRLAQLRHQMLIAMGLPACWTSAQTTAPASSEQPPVYTPAPKRTEPEVAMFDAKSCTVDAIVETLCGRGDGEYCGPTAKTVDIATMMEGLYVTSQDDARAAAKDFILDDHASEAYVTRLQSLNEKLDGKPACCYSRCTPLLIGAAKPLPTPLPPYQMRDEACIPRPPKGTTQPDANNAACPQGVQIQGELRPYTQARNDRCCYTSLQRRVIIQKGRPARVDGEPRFAALERDAAWHAAIEVDVNLDAETRRRLAASWLEAARMEHASVAAFSATSLRLMALGAPPELIAATHRAALDEIEHARIAFALASAYAGSAVSPAGFAELVRMPRAARPELVAFVVETFVDGCIGETAAALEAERASAAAVDPSIQAILARIAVDEARHAELAWQIVAWCVRREPALVDELRAAMHASAPVIDDAGDLAAHGVLGAAARRAAYDDVMRDVVAPCFAALAA